MDTMSAFALGEKNRGKEEMVFDWEKAARLIRDKKPSVVRAGLAMDWEYTGGDIYRDGGPVSKDDTYVFLAGTWAVPEIEIDGEISQCYRMKSETPGWDSDTYWPDEAASIIGY